MAHRYKIPTPKKTPKYAVIIIKTVKREHKIAFQFLFFYYSFAFADEFSIERILFFLSARRECIYFLMFGYVGASECVSVCACACSNNKKLCFFFTFSLFARRIQLIHSFVLYRIRSPLCRVGYFRYLVR